MPDHFPHDKLNPLRRPVQFVAAFEDLEVEAVSEAMVLAVKAGIDPQKVIDITSVGGAKTSAMETRGPKMIQRNFAAGFSVNNMYKDLKSVINLADTCGASLPATSICVEILRAAKTQGKGDLDSCSVLTVLEALARTEVKTVG